MITGLQIAVLVFVLIQCYFTYLNFKRREFTLRECVAWLLVWMAFGAVTLFPEVFGVVSSEFGAVRLLDFFTIFGFILVLSISFYTYVQIDRLRKRYEHLIRELSLNEKEF